MTTDTDISVRESRKSECHATGFTADDRCQSFVDQCIRERLENCPFAFYFNKVTWRFERGTLTLDGFVPTFDLTQVLQTLFLDIDHVQEIINDVQIISSTGISSVRTKPLPEKQSK